MTNVTVGDITFSNRSPFVFIAGPCQLESESHALEVATALQKITCDLGIPFIYKTSFDKANRTSVHAQRGVGFERALDIFATLKQKTGVPILTDVHEPHQCAPMAQVVDILQIPALLCRQTELLLAAGRTGLPVNVKKGQFLAPWDMKPVVQKIESTGNTRILVTERGTMFGYNALTVDMRSLVIMAEETHYPVIFDATHATQEPGNLGYASGGQRRFAPILARAAVATKSLAGVFMEVHPDPDHAPSDGPSMIKLDDVAAILYDLKNIDTLVKGVSVPA